MKVRKKEVHTHTVGYISMESIKLLNNELKMEYSRFVKFISFRTHEFSIGLNEKR